MCLYQLYIFVPCCLSCEEYRKGAGGGAGEGPKRCSSLRVGIIYECVCQAYYFISGKIVLAHTRLRQDRPAGAAVSCLLPRVGAKAAARCMYFQGSLLRVIHLRAHDLYY